MDQQQQQPKSFIIDAETLQATLDVILNSGTGNTPFSLVARVVGALQNLREVEQPATVEQPVAAVPIPHR